MDNTRSSVAPSQEVRELELSGGVRSLPQVPWWNAGRRARPKRRGGASRLLRGAPCAPLAYRSWTTRLPAFRFLLLFAGSEFVGWVERSETHRGVNKDDGYRGARHRAALRADPLAPPILQTVPGFSFRCIRTTGFRHRCLTSLARRSRRETGSALRSLLPACGEKSRSEAKRMRGPLSDSERRNSAPSGEAPSSPPSPRARGEGARMRWVPRLRRPPLTSLSRTRDM